MREIGSALYAFMDKYLSWIDKPKIGVTDVIEIIIIAFVLYHIMVWVKNTRAWMLFKGIIVILILAGLGGKNIFFICAGMMIMHWVIYTRVVRELTADGKMKNMVYAARMAGNKTPRIWIKYIFPIAAPAVLSMLALDFAGSLLAMSGYSFLGLGVQPPQADWGTLIGEAQAVFISYPRLIFFPSISILGISLSVNMIGDWIQQRYQAGEM